MGSARARGEKNLLYRFPCIGIKSWEKVLQQTDNQVSVSSHSRDCCVLSLALISGDVKYGQGRRKLWAGQLNYIEMKDECLTFFF